MTLPQTPAQVTPLWTMALALLCSLLGAAGQALFKKGADAMVLQPLALIRNLPLWGGLACYGAATVLFVLALRHGRLSTLYPIIALSYIWVFLIAWLGLGEFENRALTLNVLGLGLIVLGVAFVAMGRG